MNARPYRTEADLVLLELIRLSSGDNWDRHRAARAVLAKRHTVPALRLAHRRAIRARARSASRVAERAAVTLEEALALQGTPSNRPISPAAAVTGF